MSVSHFSGFDTLDSDFQYKIGESVLGVVKCHRDLGVKVNRDPKFHLHVSEIVRKAAGLSNSLLRATVNKSPKFMAALFVTHIRPILDYCSTVWNVGYAGDLTLLEGVQRRWTKNIDAMQGLSYTERLKSLNLFLIKGKLLLSDLIKNWKTLCCELPGFDLPVLFQSSLEEGTRGHSF